MFFSKLFFSIRMNQVQQGIKKTPCIPLSGIQRELYVFSVIIQPGVQQLSTAHS